MPTQRYAALWKSNAMKMQRTNSSMETCQSMTMMTGTSIKLYPLANVCRNVNHSNTKLSWSKLITKPI